MTEKDELGLIISVFNDTYKIYSFSIRSSIFLYVIHITGYRAALLALTLEYQPINVFRLQFGDHFLPFSLIPTIFSLSVLAAFELFITSNCIHYNVWRFFLVGDVI